MRHKLEQLRDQITQFIAQREDLLQVVACSDGDAAMVHTLIQGVDDASGSELFWLIIDEFTDAAAFAEACVRSFATKHEGARLLAEKKNLPPLPPLPSNIATAGPLPPVERVRELMIFSRSLLPTLTGCGVVWAFLPMKLAPNPAYAEFMGALWKHEMPFPWCHHMRIIVRDLFPTPLLEACAGRTPHIRTITVDFSPEAIRQALEEEAANEQTPLPERVNNALLLAGMDYGHGEYERAVQQYEVVHRYAAATQNPTLAALALNGLGEVKRAMGQTEQAGQFMQAALAPAALASPPPVPILLNLYANLGELRFGQHRWEEAEVYLQGAGDFALLMHDPELRLRSWKKLGESQYRQNKIDAALNTWRNGAIVAGKLQREDDHKEFLRLMYEHYLRQRDENGFRVALAGIREKIAEPTPGSPAPPPTPGTA